MNTETYQKPAGYTACFITYIFYLVGPFTIGILWIAGLIVAIVSKSDAAPEITGHLDYAKRVGITGLISLIIVVIISFMLNATLIGAVIAWLPYPIWWIWSLVKSIRGLNALTSGADAPGQELTWDMPDNSKFNFDSLGFLASILVIFTIAKLTTSVGYGFNLFLEDNEMLSRQQVSIVSRIEFWSMLAGIISMIFLAYSVNWRRTIKLSLLLLIGAGILSFLAPFFEFYLFSAVRALAGFGTGVIVALSLAFLGMTSKSERNFGLSVLLLMCVELYSVWAQSDAEANRLLVFLLVLPVFTACALPFLRKLPASGMGSQVVNLNEVNIGWMHTIMALAAIFIFFSTYIVTFSVISNTMKISIEFVDMIMMIMAGAFTAALVGRRLGRNIPLSIGMGGIIIVLMFFLLGMAGEKNYSPLALCIGYCFGLTYPYLLAAMSSFDPSGKMVMCAAVVMYLGTKTANILKEDWLPLVLEANYMTFILVVLFSASLVLVLLPIRAHARLTRNGSESG